MWAGPQTHTGLPKLEDNCWEGESSQYLTVKIGGDSGWVGGTAAADPGGHLRACTQTHSQHSP